MWNRHIQHTHRINFNYSVHCVWYRDVQSIDWPERVYELWDRQLQSFDRIDILVCVPDLPCGYLQRCAKHSDVQGVWYRYIQHTDRSDVSNCMYGVSYGYIQHVDWSECTDCMYGMSCGHIQRTHWTEQCRCVFVVWTR